jgi:hypothetical protein
MTIYDCTIFFKFVKHYMLNTFMHTIKFNITIPRESVNAAAPPPTSSTLHLSSLQTLQVVMLPLLGRFSAKNSQAFSMSLAVLMHPL